MAVGWEKRGSERMRERRVIRVTVVCNIVVLSLGVAVWTTEAVGFSLNGAVLGGLSESSSSEAAATGRPEQSPPPGGTPLPEPHPSARLVALPAHELEYLPPGLRQGTLAGDPALDGGCVWVETEEGPEAVRWPAGFRAGFVEDGAGAVELVDASGRVVARGGDTVYFTGSRSGGPERLERCHVGGDHVWYLGSVTTESPFD